MKKYKEFIREKIIEISREKSILDVGGGKRFTKWLSVYKDLFVGSDYKTMDFDSSTGADIVGDIHKIPLKNESIDAVICSSVLEHVKNPVIAVNEIYRILKPGGKMFVHVPSTYPYHARKNHYFDYWRFFDDTIHLLFSNFSKMEFVKWGGYFMAMSFFVPFQHNFRFLLDPLSSSLDFLFRTEKRTTTAGYYVYLIK